MSRDNAREARKGFNDSVMWKQNEEKRFTEDSYLVTACAFKPSSILFDSTDTYISGNKRKRKEVDYIFIYQHCCLCLL